VGNFKPYKYQARAIQEVVTRKRYGVFADPGLGKTAITLAAIAQLKEYDPFFSALVVAPLRVIYSTWPKEIEQWDQFKHLTHTILHGKTKNFNRLSVKDIYLINPEGLPWLFNRVDDFKTDLLVIDESSKFKNPSSQRFKLLKRNLDRFRRRVILTGTPAPNSLLDLWSQIYLLDKGEALEKNITGYRRKYFYPVGRPEWRQYEINPGADKVIHNRIKDQVLRLDAKDHLDLPPLITNRIDIQMPDKVQKQYKQLESELWAELDDSEVLANNAQHKYLMCRQFTGGAMYGEDKHTIEVHDEKVKALLDLVDELQGKPLLVAYNFRHELARLLLAFPKSFYLGSGVSPQDTEYILNKWNKGEIRVLFGQPKSMGHGLNMQKGGCNDVAWFSLTDSLEDYDQFNRRVYRHGVEGTVKVHQLIAPKTIDEALVKLLNRKERTQGALLNALNEYRRSV
jgi:SNF2 family DNA or RNA helicase